MTGSLPGNLSNFNERVFIDFASITINCPDNESPTSSNILIASADCMLPTMPGRTPNTPASAQFGANSGGGAFGNKSR